MWSVWLTVTGGGAGREGRKGEIKEDKEEGSKKETRKWGRIEEEQRDCP